MCTFTAAISSLDYITYDITRTPSPGFYLLSWLFVFTFIYCLHYEKSIGAVALHKMFTDLDWPIVANAFVILVISVFYILSYLSRI